MSLRVYRLLLFLYPVGFRRVFGAEMVAVAERHWARQRAGRRRGRGIWFWSFLGRDLIRTVPPAYFASWSDELFSVRRRLGRRFSRGTPTSPPGRQSRPGPGRGEIFGAMLRDVQIALRGLKRNPGFAAAVVAVLGLGIGANTAIFSALNAVLLRPPPFPEPERLVMANLAFTDPGGTAEPRTSPWSYPKFEILQSNLRSVQPLAGFVARRMVLTGSADPARIDVEMVSPSYFTLLGAHASLGRVLLPDENDPSIPNLVAVLGHDIWHTRFGSDPDMLGQTVTLNSHAVTVVGVLRPGFRGLTGKAALWIPMSAASVLEHPRRLTMRFSHWFHAIGRLQQDATLDAARAEARRIGETIDAAHRWPTRTELQSVSLTPFLDARVNPVARASVLVLTAAVVLVLIITCANVAGLLTARATARRREVAIRAALGASRSRLVRLYLTESLILSGIGGLAGLLVGTWGIRFLSAMWPESLGTASRNLQFVDSSALVLDPTVLAFTLITSIATGVAFGLLPAVKASRTDVSWALKHDGHGAGPRQGLWQMLSGRAVLVTGQVAIALVLLIGAALMMKSLARLQRVELGFDPSHLLTFGYEVPRSDPTSDDPASFHAAFADRVRALSGVRGVTFGCLPVSGGCDRTVVTRIVGRAPIPPDAGPVVGTQIVGDGHFDVLGARLLEGREFTSVDRADAPPVMIVNESAARLLFPGEEALGQRLAISLGRFTEPGVNAEIVGVVNDIMYRSPDLGTTVEVYLPFRQEPLPYTNVTVRTDGNPTDLVQAIRKEMRTLSANVPLDDIATMDERVAEATQERRVIFNLLAIFAGTALALAALGVYGVVAHAVNERTRELGLRMALGARGPEVVRFVLLRGLWMTTAGVAIGIAAAVGLTRFMAGFLFGITPTDHSTFMIVAAALLAVAFLAAYLPARRATTIDPLDALRAE
ncbi:MAG: ABC transporter permease [Gemmatimonadetes bacterium]|nr:ABC transporter permease [Gemmatimonadota bacterium]